MATMSKKERIANLEYSVSELTLHLEHALATISGLQRRVGELERITLPIQRFGSPDPSYMQGATIVPAGSVCASNQTIEQWTKSTKTPKSTAP